MAHRLFIAEGIPLFGKKQHIRLCGFRIERVRETGLLY